MSRGFQLTSAQMACLDTSELLERLTCPSEGETEPVKGVLAARRDARDDSLGESDFIPIRRECSIRSIRETHFFDDERDEDGIIEHRPIKGSKGK